MRHVCKSEQQQSRAWRGAASLNKNPGSSVEGGSGETPSIEMSPDGSKTCSTLNCRAVAIHGSGRRLPAGDCRHPMQRICQARFTGFMNGNPGIGPTPGSGACTFCMPARAHSARSAWCNTELLPKKGGLARWPSLCFGSPGSRIPMRGSWRVVNCF
jgi:hypothetical protein